MRQAFLIFLENVLNHKSSSQKQLTSRGILELFCHLIALSLRQNSVKHLKVTKNVKEIKFEGVWDKM